MAASPNDPQDLGAAARALSEAAASLAKALGQGLTDAAPHFSDSLATGMRQAAESMHSASSGVKTKAFTFGSDRRARKSTQTRLDLMVAAAQVIATKGYAAASVEDIAVAAGYTKGAVYTHFSTKRDLFAALAIEQLCVTEPMPTPGTLADVIADSLRTQTDPTGLLLTLEILALAIRDDEFRDTITPTWHAALTHDAAQGAANRGAEAADLTQEDRDTAVGLVVILNMTRALALAGLPSPDATDPTGADLTIRLMRRILAT
jgi:AcrR family transcriptional regulator